MPAGWVSAGMAVIGGVESYMNNKSAASAAKANNANAAVLGGAQNTMLNQATAISQQPFQAYTGTMTAPMSGNEQAGYDLAKTTAAGGVAQEDNSKATGQLDQVAANGWSADTANKYMSPYTSAVTNNAIENANRTYLQNLSGLNSKAAQNNAFGGSRNAIESGQLAGENQRNVGQITAQGNAAAYDSAVKTWQADNDTKLKTAQAYESAGQDVTNMNSTQIADLMKTGGVKQAIDQTDLSNQYAQFMRQQNWSANQLQSLVGAVGSAKGSPAQTAGVQSNIGNQLVGLGSTVAGLFGGGKNSASGDTWSVQGGTSLSSDTSNSLEGGAMDSTAPSFDSSTISGISDAGGGG